MHCSSMGYQVKHFKRNLPIFALIASSFILTCKTHLNEESSPDYEMFLTCAFGEKIEENMKPFKITDDQLVSALKCSWRGAKLYCAVGDGYSYDWVPSDKVTVKKLSKGTGPKFCNCFLIDQDRTEYERLCTVAGPFESLESKELYPQSPKLDADITPQTSPSQDFSPTRVHSKSDNTLLIAGVALTAVSLVLLASVPVVVIMRRMCNAKRNVKNSIRFASSGTSVVP